MKATSVSILLSALAIGAVATLYLKVDELGDQIARSRSERSPEARSPEPQQSRYVIQGGEGVKANPSSESGSTGSGKRRASSPATTDELATLREEVAVLKKQVASNQRKSPAWRGPRFVRNVDDLATHLKLAPSQKDRVSSSIRRAKERIDQILAIPGADGKSPKEARDERQKKIREALAKPGQNGENLVTLAMRGHRRMNEKIPGRNETYREEIARVKKETREEVAQSLTPEQKKDFDNTRIDPLIGASGGSAVAFSTSIGPGGPDGAAGIMVADEVVVDSHGSLSPPGDSGSAETDDS